MFRGWGSWLGAENGNVRVEKDDHSRAKMSSLRFAASITTRNTRLFFSGYIYNFASSVSKKVSESVAETAESLKKSVEERDINGIIDKTILGQFQKEQEKFVQENRSKTSGAAVPPWVGCNEEETVQQQILALSADRRNFLRDPPAGVHFHFACGQMYPVAMVMLEEDELLRKMRFHLVPKQVREEAFWRNYFYRVSLIKQSAQLTALAAQQAAERRQEEEETGHDPEAENQKGKTDQEVSSSPPVSEFVSDALHLCRVKEDDLRRDVQQHERLDLSEEAADWERELQEELQEYEVLEDGQNHDDGWDREIEEMLKGDS
uniref:Synapse-associated protein 1 n=1 Tax=Mola mola TaxID=94237 RepID=A0A3Q3WFX8_MOLML